MNERIKELACQAFGAAHYDDFTFAGLILQDCIGVIADAVDQREPASTYVDKIKQHFGIEDRINQPNLKGGGLHFQHPPITEE